MKKILLGFIAIGLLTFVGCDKDDDTDTTDSTETSSDNGSKDSDIVDESKLPTVTTLPIDSFGYLSALLKGIVVSEGGSTVTGRGFCWDSLPTVDINSNKSENGAGIGSFNQLIDGLEGYTTYYVRAYAINSEGIKYGGAVSFKTSSETSECICEYTFAGVQFEIPPVVYVGSCDDLTKELEGADSTVSVIYNCYER